MKVSAVGADANILMVCLPHRQRAVVCLRNSCAAVVIANGKHPPHETVLPVGFCIRKVLQIHVQFGIAVHVEDALVRACSHCGYIPRALAVVSIDSIETTLRIGKAKVAHQPLRHPVGLQPCQGWILWFRLQPIEKFKASDTNIFVVVEAITNESLLEKRRRRPGIVVAANVITRAQAQLALCSRRTDRGVGSINNRRLRDLDFPVPAAMVCESPKRNSDSP